MADQLLIVDDEQEIRAALCRHFRFLGYETLEACNGQEALDTLASMRIEVIISDISMPVMDGINFLRRVHTEYPMTHVVMMTGYVTQENIMACMRHGADRCIFKPWSDMQELEDAVKHAFAAVADWRRKLLKLHQMKGAV